MAELVDEKQSTVKLSMNWEEVCTALTGSPRVALESRYQALFFTKQTAPSPAEYLKLLQASLRPSAIYAANSISFCPGRIVSRNLCAHATRNMLRDGAKWREIGRSYPSGEHQHIERLAEICSNTVPPSRIAFCSTPCRPLHPILVTNDVRHRLYIC